MNKNQLKNLLNLTDKQFETLVDEFNKAEKIAIIKSVILGVLWGKTVGQVISEISNNNSYLKKRNYKKLNEILTKNKPLIAVAVKEILQ